MFTFAEVVYSIIVSEEIRVRRMTSTYLFTGCTSATFSRLLALVVKQRAFPSDNLSCQKHSTSVTSTVIIVAWQQLDDLDSIVLSTAYHVVQ